jgi:hypothetical protein
MPLTGLGGQTAHAPEAFGIPRTIRQETASCFFSLDWGPCMGGKKRGRKVNAVCEDPPASAARRSPRLASPRLESMVETADREDSASQWNMDSQHQIRRPSGHQPPNVHNQSVVTKINDNETELLVPGTFWTRIIAAFPVRKEYKYERPAAGTGGWRCCEEKIQGSQRKEVWMRAFEATFPKTLDGSGTTGRTRS